MNATATAPATAELVVGEPTRTKLNHPVTPVHFHGNYAGELVAVIVGGTWYEPCHRCGPGLGEHSHNGEHNRCYECGGVGWNLAKTTTEAEALRKAVNRAKAAVRREAKRAAEAAKFLAEKAEKMAAFTAAHPGLAEALAPHLPEFETEPAWWDASVLVKHYYAPRTKLAAYAVALLVEEKPLSEAAAAHAEAMMATAAAKVATAAAAGHLAEVGKRVTVEVTVTYAQGFEGTYGMRYLVSMTTEAGHVLKTWSTGEFGWQAEKGAKATVKATVKAHGEYQGAPQTELTRVALVGEWTPAEQA